MRRKRLHLDREVVRILTAGEIGGVQGGLPKADDANLRGGTGLCGSGGCTSLIDACPVTMNCGL